MNTFVYQKFTFHFLFLLVACLSLSQCASHSGIVEKNTPSQLDQIRKTGILKVGTTGDYKPFSYQIPSAVNQYYGIDIELAKDLAQSLGVKVQFVKTSWPNLMDDFQAGKFDIGMSGITIKLDRQYYGLFSIPLLTSGKIPITRDEDAQRFNSIESINQAGVRVIVNPGGTNEAFTRTNFPKADIILNPDNLSIFQKIVDGQADVMVTDAEEALVQEQIHPELQAVNPNQFFNFYQKGYLLPRDHTFKAYVDQWINLRQGDGTFDKLFKAELSKIKNQFAK